MDEATAFWLLSFIGSIAIIGMLWRAEATEAFRLLVATIGVGLMAAIALINLIAVLSAP